MSWSYRRWRSLGDSYKNLTKAQEKFDQTDGLWQTISRWNEKTDMWMNEPFSSINAEGLNGEVQGFVKEAFSFHKKVREGDTYVATRCCLYESQVRTWVYA